MVESRRVGDVVGVQDFFIKPANYLPVFGAPFRRESTRQHPERVLPIARYENR